MTVVSGPSYIFKWLAGSVDLMPKRKREWPGRGVVKLSPGVFHHYASLVLALSTESEGFGSRCWHQQPTDSKRFLLMQTVSKRQIEGGKSDVPMKLATFVEKELLPDVLKNNLQLFQSMKPARKQILRSQFIVTMNLLGNEGEDHIDTGDRNEEFITVSFCPTSTTSFNRNDLTDPVNREGLIECHYWDSLEVHRALFNPTAVQVFATFGRHVDPNFDDMPSGTVLWFDLGLEDSTVK